MIDEQGNFLELRVLAEGLGAEIGASLLFELYGKCFVPLHDHRGRVITLIDLETRSPAATYRYTSFGEETIEGFFSPLGAFLLNEQKQPGGSISEDATTPLF